MIRKVGIIMAKDNTQQQNTQQKIKSILYSNDNAQQMVPRYKKLYFPLVIVQQITLATTAIFRHNSDAKINM